jgi:tetratricopeptide (TPR) repeat protein
VEQRSILRIVVASPSDVQSERDVLSVVTNELNRGIAAERDLRLELSQWETDAYPGFHPEGPQGLIDFILRIEDCDILIVVFWKRFGKPVKDAESGTEHEFRVAYETWKKQGRPQIMVYFNEKPYTPKSKEEIDQWGKVIEFKRTFPKEGLWWRYKGKVEFEKLVRDHLTQFIRNLEHPITALQPLSKLSPRICHPYIMPKHWTGREEEMDRLDVWLKHHAEQPIFVMVAIGGMGKSSLIDEWLRHRIITQRQALKLECIFQFSFYEGESSFQRFIEEMFDYLRISNKSKGTDALTLILDWMAEHDGLLVLDGFERLLRAYASQDDHFLPERSADQLEPRERQCADMLAWRFLRKVSAGCRTKILLTTRLFPKELDDVAACLKFELTGLNPRDAVAFLRINKIKGTEHELEKAGKVYEFHPLSLTRLVNVLKYDLDWPNDIRQAPQYDVTLDLQRRQRHILEKAYRTLPSVEGQFLSATAANRGKLTMELIRTIAVLFPEIHLSQALRRFEEDNWILWNRNENTNENTIDFHPVVRRYAYSQLIDKKAVHELLKLYWEPHGAGVDVEKITQLEVVRIEDFTPLIELYYHTARAERYDEAYHLFCDRLHNPFYYRLGAYQLCIELLRDLFPDGESYPPRLNSEEDQGWTLTAMANSYSLYGQSSKAVSLYSMAIDIDRKMDDKKNLAICLGNLAVDQIHLGQLRLARQNLQQRIELCQDIRDQFIESTGHMHLGWLLSLCGEFEESEQELSMGLSMIKHLMQNTEPNISKTIPKKWSPDETRKRLYQRKGVNYAYRAFRLLLMDKPETAVNFAKAALRIAMDRKNERDTIRAQWLFGAIYRRMGWLSEAEKCLTEALTRCRKIDMIDHEANILLDIAQLRFTQTDSRAKEEAHALAAEALEIANRCEYRLSQADIHNFMAQLMLDIRDIDSATRHVESARERAWCDGPPYSYWFALDIANRLLRKLGDSS